MPYTRRSSQREDIFFTTRHFRNIVFPTKTQGNEGAFLRDAGAPEEMCFCFVSFGEAKTGSLKTEYIRIDHNFLWSVQRCACKRASESIQTTFELRFNHFLGALLRDASVAIETVWRHSQEFVFIESLILAQDERWRRG